MRLRSPAGKAAPRPLPKRRVTMAVAYGPIETGSEGGPRSTARAARLEDGRKMGRLALYKTREKCGSGAPPGAPVPADSKSITPGGLQARPPFTWRATRDRKQLGS